MKKYLFYINLFLLSLMAIFLLFPKTGFCEKKEKKIKAQVVENSWVKLIGIVGENDKDPENQKGNIITGVQNSKGNLYIVRNSPSRVLVYDALGNFLFKFGQEGDGPGQFRRAFGVATDSKDQVYVSDVIRKKIVIFSPFGDYINEFSSNSAITKDDNYQQSVPGCIAINKKKDLLYISDPLNGHIWIHDLSGKFNKCLNGPKPGEFCTPGIIRFGKDDKIYVPEGMCDRIRVFNKEGSEILTIGGEKGDRIGDFSRLTGIALDSRARVYASDCILRCVQVFDPEGNFFGAIKWVNEGSDEIYFVTLTDIFSGKDNTIYIIDQGANKIYIIQDTK